MYLHLGNNCVIPEREIIGIFDMDNTTVSKHTRHLLRLAEKGGRVTAVTNGSVYLCQISPSALAGRAEQGISIQTD